MVWSVLFYKCTVSLPETSFVFMVEDMLGGSLLYVWCTVDR